MNRSLRASDFRRTWAGSARTAMSRPQPTRASDTTGWVPQRNRPIPAAGSYRSSIANGRACPHQPDTGDQNRSWWRRCTHTKAGEPGPPFRYLYVHPTAKSASAAETSTGSAPAEWARSQMISAP